MIGRLRELAQGRDDIRVECAGTIACSWFAGARTADLVFRGIRGAALRYPVFQRGALNQACEQIGIPRLTPHELRHTAASLAIASGADIRSCNRCWATSRRR